MLFDMEEINKLKKKTVFFVTIKIDTDVTCQT